MFWTVPCHCCLPGRNFCTHQAIVQQLRQPLGFIVQLAQVEPQGVVVDAAEPGRFEVSLGLKHAEPKVEDTARRVASDGVDAVVNVAGILRETFVEQYSEDVLGKFYEEMKEQLGEELAAKLPPPPKSGSLDLNLILDAEYTFA